MIRSKSTFKLPLPCQKSHPFHHSPSTLHQLPLFSLCKHISTTTMTTNNNNFLALLSDSEDDGAEDLIALTGAFLVESSTSFLEEYFSINGEASDGDPHLHLRGQPRRKRKLFDHRRAYECLQADYLSPKPLFDDKQFDLMFQISRSRFQRLMDNIGNASAEINKFWLSRETTFNGAHGAFLESKLLLPLKTHHILLSTIFRCHPH